VNYLEEALRVLAGNKIRSLLTITGLIIGVAAVIAIQVLGNGLAGAISGTLGDLNDNAFIIFPNAQQRNFERASIRLSDLDAIRNEVPNVVSVIPAGGTTDLTHTGHKLWRLIIYPDSDDRFNNTPLVQGRAFTQDEIAGASSVCVLSNNAYQKLFPDGGNAIGASVYAGNYRYIVVGVQEPPKTGIINLTFGGDIAIPYTVYQQRYLHGRIAFAGRFTVADSTTLAQTEVAVIQKLQSLHRNATGVQYQTFDKQSFSNGINGIFGAMTLIVALIGAVSLLVAGIGIMNIMLVSVTERTREIGIRKAIGAQRAQILAQFFIEALALSCVGCGIGLGIGLLIGWLVDKFAIIAITGYVAPVPWLQSTLIAVGFATLVTLAFGTYPAYRAASLDPIEALRYE